MEVCLMTSSLRAVPARTSAVVGAILILGMVVTPAVAQQIGSLVPSLNLSTSNSARDATALPAGDAQAPAPPAPTPEEVAKKQDSATMEFFRKTEVSGFVDM